MSLGRRSVEGVVLPAVGVAVVALAFEVAPRVGLLSRSSFPPTSEVATTLLDLFGTAEASRPAALTAGRVVRHQRGTRAV
jgi:ABC-type nitrate/sulfonate/bicarbonate transport system permease component